MQGMADASDTKSVNNNSQEHPTGFTLEMVEPLVEMLEHLSEKPVRAGPIDEQELQIRGFCGTPVAQPQAEKQIGTSKLTMSAWKRAWITFLFIMGVVSWIGVQQLRDPIDVLF